MIPTTLTRLSCLGLLVAIWAGQGQCQQVEMPADIVELVHANLKEHGTARPMFLRFEVYPAPDGEKLTQGSANNLGRSLAMRLADALSARGVERLAPNFMVDRLQETNFTLRDMFNLKQVATLLETTPKSDAIVSGFVYPTLDHAGRLSSMGIEVLIIRMKNNRLLPEQLPVRKTLPVTPNLEVVVGNDKPMPPPPLPSTSAEALTVPKEWMEVLVDGQSLPVSLVKNKRHIVAPIGKNYSIKLNNLDNVNGYVVSLLVDGLATIADWDRCGPTLADRQSVSWPSEQKKWLLRAGKSDITIPGWQKDKATASRFVFAAKTDPMAEDHPFIENAGVITAAFYRILRPDEPRDRMVTLKGEDIPHEVNVVKIEYEPEPVHIISIHY